MNKRFFFTLTAVLLLSNSPLLFSAEPTTGGASPAGTNTASDSVKAELGDLVSRINDKIKNDKTNETDLDANLKEFDTLLAKHKEAPSDERAQVLVMKAQLYLQVLNEPEKALVVFKQIKSDYPATQINGSSDKVITAIEEMIERKKASAVLATGAPFPDFAETDVEGKPLSISKYKGKVVLVDFWATWCGPCIAKLPEIQQAYDKFHDKGFEIVGISLDEDKGKLEQFIKQRKMPWPEFFDGKRWENKLAVKYGVDATPTGYLLSRDGKILAKLSGEEDLDSEIAKALKN